MELLRRVAGFGASTEDLKTIYILFIRSILEHSATVWHSSLSQENIDLERIQKSATKIILKNEFQGYQNALNRLELKTLSERRENLCLIFAIKCTKNSKLSSMFPRNFKNHQLKLCTYNKITKLIYNLHAKTTK